MRSNALTVMVWLSIAEEVIGATEAKKTKKTARAFSNIDLMVQVGKYDSFQEYLQSYRAQGLIASRHS
jgi:hypothetical protein